MKQIFMIFLFIVMSCSKATDDCPDNLACTEVFVSICTKITKEGTPSFKPSKLEVIFTDTGESKTITSDFNETYCFINDNEMKRVKKSGSPVQLIGKDGFDKELFNEKYIIGHDCCHVFKISGKDFITIK